MTSLAAIENIERRIDQTVVIGTALQEDAPGVWLVRVGDYVATATFNPSVLGEQRSISGAIAVSDEVVIFIPDGKLDGEAFILGAVLQQPADDFVDAVPLSTGSQNPIRLLWEFPSIIENLIGNTDIPFIGGDPLIPAPKDEVVLVNLQPGAGGLIRGNGGYTIRTSQEDGTEYEFRLHNEGWDIIRYRPGDRLQHEGWRWQDMPIFDPARALNVPPADALQYFTGYGAFLHLRYFMPEILHIPLAGVKQARLLEAITGAGGSPIASTALIIAADIPYELASIPFKASFHRHSLPLLPDISPIRFIWREE